MAWPGAPKSASSPPLNPPSTRYPFTLNENSSMKDVAGAVRTLFNGLTVHEQAFANLPGEITKQASAAATSVVENIESETVSPSVKAFNALTGLVIFFPNLGRVNNQIGQTAYESVQSDAGSLVLFGDASGVAVTLQNDFSIFSPWFSFFFNFGPGTTTVTPASGTINNAATLTLAGSAWAIIFYDNTNFWALISSTAPAPSYVPQGGPTSNRPGVPTLYQVYLDTTIGVPVWWDGAEWVSAAGASDGAFGAGPSEPANPYTPQGGPTSNRPATPLNYWVYFDTTVGIPEWWTSADWVNASGFTDGATGTGPTGSGYIPLGGTTGARPAVPIIYSVYFDTTLGQPVWWTGATWINAAGVPS